MPGPLLSCIMTWECWFGFWKVSLPSTTARTCLFLTYGTYQALQEPDAGCEPLKHLHNVELVSLSPCSDHHQQQPYDSNEWLTSSERRVIDLADHGHLEYSFPIVMIYNTRRSYHRTRSYGESQPMSHVSQCPVLSPLQP
jgi:hypothetical protein